MSLRRLARSWPELRARMQPGPRAVVMTMGALHQGHLDLVEAANRHRQSVGGQVVVTIFVNPLQFGPAEDFDTYPRTLEADLEALAGRGVDLVYAPSANDMYPRGRPQVGIDPGPLGNVFEGAIRPGHFAGVATVVHKLAARTGATAAVFGQKDAQQLAVIRQMKADLDLGWEVIAVPTRREADGLALSSRNRYLSAAEREEALALPHGIAAGQAAARDGAQAGEVRRAALAALGRGERLSLPDYLDLVDPATFQPVRDAWRGPALLIGALKVGRTRLIDNAEVALGA
ncbi:MAG: pantoate--beta-alanine ligase [Bifidobacteriaceae bacterium]|jgi:pantoate--beta-alanine ligase|nr:pantoate--beta-alanine ligase [Bifidobacteriaceae bacterium]